MCDSVETKKCMNCKIDVLLNNFEVHSLHCLKNFYFCTKCQKPVNNSKKVEHEENHFIIQCVSCNANIDQHYLNDHLQYDCPKRKVRCQICDIDVEATNIDEHEDYCGSRTEKCIECNEYVMLKYKAIHLDSNHSFFKLPDEPGPSPSWQNSKRMLFDYIPDLTVKQCKQKVSQKKKFSSHQDSKFKVSQNWNEKGFKYAQRENLLDDSEENKKLLPSKLNSLELPEENFTSEIDYPVTKKGGDIYPILPGFRQLQLKEEPIKCSKQVFNTVEKSEDDNCFNNSMSTSKSDDSQAKQMPELCNFYNENSKVRGKNLEKNIHSSRNSAKYKPKAKINFDKNCYADFYVESKEFNKVQNVEIPCEFCSKLVPIQDLVEHQATCDLIYGKNIIRRKLYLNREFLENDDVKLPCEICEKLFKVSQLETHQYCCKINSAKSHLKSESVLDKRNEMHKTSYNQFNNFENPTENQSTINRSTAQCKSLNKSDKGAIPKTVKVSRKNRRAPSPPKS